MHFKTVFDAANQGYPAWPQVGIGLALVGMGLLLVFAPTLMQQLMPRGLQGTARTIFSWFFLVASSLFTFFTFITTSHAYGDAEVALRDGRYSVATGPVMNFVPMPYTGHSLESFEVGGHKFTYSDYVLTPGFRTTTSHGGPIHEGLNVRVSYVGNLILRLETAQ
jgi:hypothetical protein